MIQLYLNALIEGSLYVFSTSPRWPVCRAGITALGTPLEVQCNVCGDAYALPIDTALQLLRIAQEALSNTLKYADAQHLTIELVFEPEQTQLRVQDDGRGFEVEQATAAGGFGLLSMRARAKAIGAELTICSAMGQGTTVLVALPRPTGESRER
ncbi:MAG TPA: ATP-binding protein [Roseiflexaceae bacterium]|nr:ATP-binding protein [Roseiflexaceae bacterium]